MSKMHGNTFLHVLISNRECRDGGGAGRGDGRGHAVSLLITVVLGRRRPLRRPNHRRWSANYRRLRSLCRPRSLT